MTTTMPHLTSWLIQLGISEDLLLVLIFVPILATLITFSRYITGIKTFGIYASMILSFAYYFMGARQGFIITVLVIFSSWLIRNILRKVRLHYLSRLAIVYSSISIIILAFIAITCYIPSDNPILDFRYLQPVPLAMIISVTDRFMANYIKKDLATALRLTTETVLISILGWAIMRITSTREFFINNLWILPLSVVINFLIGKYAGLRWTELIRFKQITKNVEPAK